jgi:hypothetical protein
LEDLAELERVLAAVDLGRKSRASDIVHLDKMEGAAIWSRGQRRSGQKERGEGVTIEGSVRTTSRPVTLTMMLATDVDEGWASRVVTLY